jgi:hypothetical protein
MLLHPLTSILLHLLIPFPFVKFKVSLALSSFAVFPAKKASANEGFDFFSRVPSFIGFPTVRPRTFPLSRLTGVPPRLRVPPRRGWRQCTGWCTSLLLLLTERTISTYVRTLEELASDPEYK